jgi:NAD(P)-dependent dehydrogenase (short-subunit alcohol dehydrogenase family)
MNTALITGANKGIGYEIARQLGKHGFNIILTARSTERGMAAVKNIAKENIKCEFVEMDVSELDSIQRAFEIVAGKYQSIEVLVNNAGIMTEKSDILKSDNEIVFKIFNTNSVGPLLVAKTFSPLLKKGSRIINVSSGLGSICNGMQNYSPIYSISKTALNAITCQLSYAFEPLGVAVNAMCPGWVQTDMGGSGASRSVEKGAETAVWLATEAPAELTGKIFRDKKELHW